MSSTLAPQPIAEGNHKIELALYTKSVQGEYVPRSGANEVSSLPKVDHGAA